jgi:methyltransferase
MGEQPKEGVHSNRPVLLAELSTPAAPRERRGAYWGYITRIAPSLQAALEECPFDGGYDLTIGTSERGDVGSAALGLPRFSHALVVFGGPEGLERCLGGGDPRGLFHRYLNTCERQGSRTIRTEEAVPITMAYLRPALEAAHQRR